MINIFDNYFIISNDGGKRHNDHINSYILFKLSANLITIAHQ